MICGLALASKVTAALIITAVAITLLVVALQEAAPQPYLPLVAASAFECRQLQNPCEYLDCWTNHPRGGVDPDAGERDNRRIA